MMPKRTPCLAIVRLLFQRDGEHLIGTKFFPHKNASEYLSHFLLLGRFEVNFTIYLRALVNHKIIISIIARKEGLRLHIQLIFTAISFDDLSKQHASIERAFYRKAYHRD